MGLFKDIAGGVANVFGIPNNTKLGQFLGSPLSATEKNARKGRNTGVVGPGQSGPINNGNMGLFSGVSGGISFGKNQSIILGIAAVIFAVALAVTRGFGLFAGKRRRR